MTPTLTANAMQKQISTMMQMQIAMPNQRLTLRLKQKTTEK
jgi:hypothetical protein